MRWTDNYENELLLPCGEGQFLFAEGGNDRDNPEKDILSACGGEIPFSDEIMKGLLRDAHSGA